MRRDVKYWVGRAWELWHEAALAYQRSEYERQRELLDACSLAREFAYGADRLEAENARPY